MRIGLVFGGNTTEGEVSRNSASGVRVALQKLGYDVIDIEFDKNIAQHIADANIDIVYNSMHGQYGEDGRLQGLLDIMQIPHTHSGLLASAMAMNKTLCKDIFNHLGIQTPEGIVIDKEDLFNDSWKEKVASSNVLQGVQELFVKPICDGSSRDVFLIKDIATFDFKNIELSTSSNKFLVEKRIFGREIQVAVLGGEPQAVGMLEVVPNGEFYDYTAKYSENGAKHLQPDITANIAQNIMENAIKMHKTLGLKDISRSEFLLTDKNDIIALEINSHPGFTATSIVPEIAINAGIKYEEIVEMLVKNAKFGC